MALADRLHKSPSEILDWDFDTYVNFLAYARMAAREMER